LGVKEGRRGLKRKLKVTIGGAQKVRMRSMGGREGRRVH